MDFSCFNGTRNCDYCGSCHSKFKERISDEKRRIYNQALDDFVKECGEYKDLTFSEEHIERIKMIAEQLKR